MVLTDTPVKNALAEAQQNKKKRVDPGAKKGLNKMMSKKETKSNNKGKKLLPKKSALNTRKPSAATKNNKPKNSDKTVCLLGVWRII